MRRPCRRSEISPCRYSEGPIRWIVRSRCILMQRCSCGDGRTARRTNIVSRMGGPDGAGTANRRRAQRDRGVGSLWAIADTFEIFEKFTLHGSAIPLSEERLPRIFGR